MYFKKQSKFGQDTNKTNNTIKKVDLDWSRQGSRRKITRTKRPKHNKGETW